MVMNRDGTIRKTDAAGAKHGPAGSDAGLVRRLGSVYQNVARESGLNAPFLIDMDPIRNVWKSLKLKDGCHV